MQVNNVSSPQFGMSLRITDDGFQELQKLPNYEYGMKILKDLNGAGELLKDTKYYDLEVGKNLDLWVVDKEKNEKKLYSMFEKRSIDIASKYVKNLEDAKDVIVKKADAEKQEMANLLNTILTKFGPQK